MFCLAVSINVIEATSRFWYSRVCLDPFDINIIQRDLSSALIASLEVS